jgi:hypothetical protein
MAGESGKADINRGYHADCQKRLAAPVRMVKICGLTMIFKGSVLLDVFRRGAGAPLIGRAKPDTAIVTTTCTGEISWDSKVLRPKTI